jgi:hypothetical protein
MEMDWRIHNDAEEVDSEQTNRNIYNPIVQ